MAGDVSRGARRDLQERTGRRRPRGDTQGTAILAGSSMARGVAQMARVAAWKGKVFNMFAEGGEKGVVVNKVGPFGMKLVVATVYRGASWMDNKETIVIDYAGTSVMAG